MAKNKTLVKIHFLAYIAKLEAFTVNLNKLIIEYRIQIMYLHETRVSST